MEKQLKSHIRRGINSIIDNMQVSGVVTVRDKDGNIKSEMQITNFEVNEEQLEKEQDDATE